MKGTLGAKLLQQSKGFRGASGKPAPRAAPASDSDSSYDSYGSDDAEEQLPQKSWKKPVGGKAQQASYSSDEEDEDSGSEQYEDSEDGSEYDSGEEEEEDYSDDQGSEAGSEDEPTFGQLVARGGVSSGIGGSRPVSGMAGGGLAGLKRPRPEGSGLLGQPAKKLARVEPGRLPGRPSRHEEEDEEDHDDDEEGGLSSSKKKRRDAPMEMSTTRPVGRFRQVIAVPKVVRRDPRFEATAGSLNADAFRASYGFLNEYRAKEIAELKARLKKTKDREQAATMQQMLTRLQQEKANAERAEAMRAVMKERKSVESAAVAAGKAPYFPKKRELKELAAVQRFKSLEAAGDKAVEKALKKRRLKLSQRDRKWLPNQRKH